MNEILELLVAGGYFRARIKGLHNFDKVIGGMCWAIQMCNIDVEVDVCLEKILRLDKKSIQWLVRKSLETRKQNADYIRSYSTWQFDRIFCDPSKRSDSNDSTRSSIPDYGLLNPIKTSLKRKYYHPNRLKLQDEMLRVKATLLEYEIDGLDRDAITIPHSAEYSNKTLEHSQTDLTSDSERMLLNSMSQTKDDENDMLEISSDTERLKIIEIKTSELETNEDEDRLEKVRLSELLKVLRKQKSQLKQQCREEKERLERQIKSIESNRLDEEQRKERLENIDQKLKHYQKQFDTVRKELSSINKRHAIIQRKFDDIPNRTELAQYQKRFLELYNQLSNKHVETKKFYTLYNTLSDERMYLEKEFNLINSILENFQKASISNSMIKEEFLVKFQQTVDSIVQTKIKVEQKLSNEKEKRDKLRKEYGHLIEEQCLYCVAVKAFKEVSEKIAIDY
ncbi:Coiled-coil domain-containing protein 93 [Sarcoptes scabiei]|uniref:Coiled-coil domain-containing protein 93 n=1 Tax=Sarcoptes scabiei TaxID=52283 RepID=A0A834RH80_SARSC|nr:Coiled-coil domain-containing protein 93 [Sarcoptes scabiei]